MEGDGKRILVVDDNRDIRRMVSLLLMSAGYSVSEAGDGAEAVAELQKRRYEVILTDVRMPHLNGRDLLKICRDLYPLTPVIVAPAAEQSVVGPFLERNSPWRRSFFAPAASGSPAPLSHSAVTIAVPAVPPH